jgi:hypothetical protein
MPDQPVKRDEAQIERKVLPRKLVVPVVSYEAIADVSEIEIQQRLDRIFRVIFDEVAKRREEKNRQLQTSEYILKKHE